MVEAIDPKIGEKIIDPFCGTGGFLIYAFEVVSEKIRLQEFSSEEKQRWRLDLSNRSLYGTDWKERTSQACKMNMMVHGDGSSGVFMHDGFADIPSVIEEGQFHICLTNPPFGSMETDPTTLARHELGAGRKSQDRVILALERALRLVRPGGQVGIVVIDGVLNAKRRRYVRDYLRRHAWIKGVVSLNSETFEGYGARAKTSILFMEKKAIPSDDPQGPVFMAVARNTGLAPNGDPIPGNVLPDILLDYRTFRKGQLRPGQSGQHSESLCVELVERLDAEYYARKAHASTVDLVALRREVEMAQTEVTQAYAALGDAGTTLRGLGTCPVSLKQMLEQVEARERIDPDDTYRLLGVRWWGEGAFIREEKLGRDIKANWLFRASAGWIIYNRLFAFRGSFAMLCSDHDGCYASNEFPMFRAKAGVPDGHLLCRYIVHCLNSPQYLAIVDAESTGSTKTSRNRFNEEEFLDFVIQVPQTAADLHTAVLLLDGVSDLRRRQQRLLELTKTFREEILGLLPEPAET